MNRPQKCPKRRKLFRLALKKKKKFSSFFHKIQSQIKYNNAKLEARMQLLFTMKWPKNSVPRLSYDNFRPCLKS